MKLKTKIERADLPDGQILVTITVSGFPPITKGEVVNWLAKIEPQMERLTEKKKQHEDSES